MKIQIRSWRDGSVLFETDAETIGNAVVAAIAAKSDLRSADLSSADLSFANLRSANLRSADLRSANLSSAKLRSANLLKLLPIRTILPDGDLIGWKSYKMGSFASCEFQPRQSASGD